MLLFTCVVMDLTAMSGHCAVMFLSFSDSNSISFLSAMLSHPFSPKVLSAHGLFLLSLVTSPASPGSLEEWEVSLVAPQVATCVKQYSH